MYIMIIPIHTNTILRNYWDMEGYPKSHLLPTIQHEREWKIQSLCHRILPNTSDHVLHRVTTVNGVLSHKECNWIINEVEKHGHMYGWMAKRNGGDVTTGLDIRRILSLSYYSMNLVYSHIIPIVNRRYGVTPNMLGINEVYVLKSESGGSRALDAHMSGGEFNFVIHLNQNFTGGGITFLDHHGRKGTHHTPRTGRMVVFSKVKSHYEDPVLGPGVRYVLGGQLGYGMAYPCDELQRRKYTLPPEDDYDDDEEYEDFLDDDIDTDDL